jgi:hypothetical protein
MTQLAAEEDEDPSFDGSDDKCEAIKSVIKDAKVIFDQERTTHHVECLKSADEYNSFMKTAQKDYDIVLKLAKLENCSP